MPLMPWIHVFLLTSRSMVDASKRCYTSPQPSGSCLLQSRMREAVAQTTASDVQLHANATEDDAPNKGSSSSSSSSSSEGGSSSSLSAVKLAGIHTAFTTVNSDWEPDWNQSHKDLIKLVDAEQFTCSFFKEKSKVALQQLQARIDLKNWTEVTFKSRAGEVEPLGWERSTHETRTVAPLDITALMCIGSNESEDRWVIVQHGVSGNYKKHDTMTLSAMLCSAGFNTLAPNLRNHGTSAKTSDGKVTYGIETVFDLLGAWDYLERSYGVQAGILSISNGGLEGAIAVGREPRVAAYMGYGTVFDAVASIKFSADLYVPLASLFYDSIISAISEELGYDLKLHNPKQSVEDWWSCQQPIGIIHPKNDNFVLYDDQVMPFEAAIAAKCGEAKKDAIWLQAPTYQAPAECGNHNGPGTMHSRWHLEEFDQMQAYLNEFWGHVFNITPEA